MQRERLAQVQLGIPVAAALGLLEGRYGGGVPARRAPRLAEEVGQRALRGLPLERALQEPLGAREITAPVGGESVVRKAPGIDARIERPTSSRTRPMTLIGSA